MSYKSYTFIVRGGQTLKAGKSYYPETLTLSFHRPHDALRVLADIANGLVGCANDEGVSITLVGALVEEDEKEG